MSDADLYHPNLTGCSDGGCIIKPPVGMHTNGGCGCEREIRRAGHKGTDAIRTIHYLRSELSKKNKATAALSAQVEGMREALDELYNYAAGFNVSGVYLHDEAEGEELLCQAAEALTLTPPASLALHDAEVLEGIASEYDQVPEREVFCSTIAQELRDHAEFIRSGKKAVDYGLCDGVCDD